MKKNWTTRLMAGIAAGTMVFSLAGCGSSSDGKKSADKEKFIVGFDAAFPPYGYQDENGEYVLLNGNQTLVLLMSYQLTRWDSTWIWRQRSASGTTGNWSSSPSTGMQRTWS